MNAAQFRALPSSRSELCRKAGLSPNAIRMRVERGGELREEDRAALDAAMLPYVHVDDVMKDLETIKRQFDLVAESLASLSLNLGADCTVRYARDIAVVIINDWKARCGDE